MCPYLPLELPRSGCSHGSTVRDVCLRTSGLSGPVPARSLAFAVRCRSRARWPCALKVSGPRAIDSLAVEDRTSSGDHRFVRAAPSNYEARCDVLGLVR